MFIGNSIVFLIFWCINLIKIKEQLAIANCLAPGKGEERFVRSKVEIRVLDIKT